jgi:DNA/RNA-binding domain of Phe-tRNA-synthetase-like protein
MRTAQPTPLLTATTRWLQAGPDACCGAMLMSGLRNPESDAALDEALDGTAAELRAAHSGATRAELLASPVLAAYAAYYRRFDKTYHVLLQLESVALKGKPLRARGALVGAMFRAELRDGMLTAGHDATALAGGLTVDVVDSGDRYVGIGGREVSAAAGDMCIRDGTGIVSSIVYGPDDRTRLGPETRSAVFTSYAPGGIGPQAVRDHLAAIAESVRLFSPDASVGVVEIVPGADATA